MKAVAEVLVHLLVHRASRQGEGSGREKGCVGRGKVSLHLQCSAGSELFVSTGFLHGRKSRSHL